VRGALFWGPLKVPSLLCTRASHLWASYEDFCLFFLSSVDGILHVCWVLEMISRVSGVVHKYLCGRRCNVTYSVMKVALRDVKDRRVLLLPNII
jgi:hypothetical protein